MNSPGMREHEQIAARETPKRIGILLGDLGKLNLRALKYLVLNMNSLQSAFQYEFLDCDPDDELILTLCGRQKVNRKAVKRGIPAFIKRQNKYFQNVVAESETQEPSPSYFILLSLAKFADGYYTTRVGDLSILALGNWKKSMAPPSILEFFLTLIVRESIAAVSPSLAGSIHLGTKSCAMDFTPYLQDVRLKVLHGFICDFCRKRLLNDNLPRLADEILPLLKRDWLGRSIDPHSPAALTSKLGFNLFTTKGLEPGFWESVFQVFQKDGVKELIRVMGAIILLILVSILGLEAVKH